MHACLPLERSYSMDRSNWHSEPPGAGRRHAPLFQIPEDHLLRLKSNPLGRRQAGPAGVARCSGEKEAAVVGKVPGNGEYFSPDTANSCQGSSLPRGRCEPKGQPFRVTSGKL